MVAIIIHCIPGHSQDINNTATPMLMRDAIHRSYIPSMEALVETLRGGKVASLACSGKVTLEIPMIFKLSSTYYYWIRWGESS